MPKGDVVPPLARTYTGQTGTEAIADGMVITFDAPCPSISGMDILLIRSVAGEPLRLLPDEERDDGCLFVFYGLGTHAPSLRGTLNRLDDRRWQFHMPAHHALMRDAGPD